MFAWDIGYWFCCLADEENVVLKTTAEALVVTLFLGVPVDIWDAFWLVFPYGGAARREAFLSIYKLEIVTIGTGDDAITVVRPRSGFLSVWVSWSLFVVTPAAACLNGCQQSRVP